MKAIDNLTLPMFKLSGRREVKGLKSIKFYAQGIVLGSNSIQSNAKFKSEIVIDNKKTIENCKPLEACVSLGEYLTKNPTIIQDIASNYIKYLNLDNIIKIYWSRNQKFSIESYKITTLNKNFVSFSIHNSIDVYSLNEKAIKVTVYHDKTLVRRLTKYLQYCGIGEGEYFDLTDMQLISTDCVLDIFDFCMEVYNDFCKLQVGELDMSIAMNLQVTFHDGIPKIERSVTNMKSMIYLSMLSHYKGKSLNSCLYCTDLFFGRKNQSFCCTNCSDLYNGKYERRKERKNDKKNK